MVYSVFFVVFIVCAPSFALTKIECVLKDGSVYAYNITVKFLLSSLQNVFFFVAKSNFFLREMEHTFVYACFRTCRAILNMNCVGLRKTSATEKLIAVILTLVTGLVI